MQIAIFRLTGNPYLNLVFAIMFWFIIFMICSKIATRKDFSPNPLIYPGLVMAAITVGLFSIYGSNVGIVGIVIGIVAFVLVMTSIFESLPRRGPTYTRYSEPFKPPKEVVTIECPDCSLVIQVKGGVIRPDGSVICTKCFKKFTP